MAHIGGNVAISMYRRDDSINIALGDTDSKLLPTKFPDGTSGWALCMS